MAAVRQLVVMKTAGELSLLEVSGNVLVGHLLHSGLKQVALLVIVRPATSSAFFALTSSSDHDLFPPADILRARSPDAFEF